MLFNSNGVLMISYSTPERQLAGAQVLFIEYLNAIDVDITDIATGNKKQVRGVFNRNSLVKYGESLLKLSQATNYTEWGEVLSVINDSQRDAVFAIIKMSNKDLFNTMMNSYLNYQKTLYIADVDKIISEQPEVCPLCGGTGIVQDPVFGLDIECECQRRGFKSKNDIRQANLKHRIAEMPIIEDNEEMLKRVEAVTGSRNLDTQYSKDEVTMTLTALRARLGQNNISFTAKHFPTYDATLNKILETVKDGRARELNSYLIGSAEYFCISKFVDQCLIEIVKHNQKAVPMVELSTLMRSKIEMENSVLNTLYSPSASIKYSAFGWDKYLNADLVFVRLEDSSNKLLEAKTLSLLLKERGARKLPTIALTSYNMRFYLQDTKIRETYWDDILHWGSKSETTNKSVLNYIYTYLSYK